jgi:hypothetical protein
LAKVDKIYDQEVRQRLLDHDAWVGGRWLIVPRRAGGRIGVDTAASKGRRAKVRALELVAYLVDELAKRVVDARTVEDRAAALADLQRIAALGAATGDGAAGGERALKALRRELARPSILAVWSVPLAAFDPRANRFRELAFSYQ